MRIKAFTLVELLITATLLVVVGGYAVVIFSSTVSLNYQAQRSAGATAQSRKALEVIAEEFAQSDTAGSTWAILNSDDPSGSGSIFFHTARVSDTAGALTTGTSEKRIYCAQPVAGTTPTRYRLARFTTTQNYTANANPVNCSASSLEFQFGNLPVDGPEFLTDEYTNVVRFQALMSQYSLSANVNVPGVRLILTTAYDPTGLTGESRADVSSSAFNVTLQTTAYRNYPNISPFSGL